MYNHIKKQTNQIMVALASRFGKLYSPEQGLFTEPSEPQIPQDVSFLDLSLRNMIENGTLTRGVNTQNFGVDVFAATDALRATADKLNNDIESAELAEKERLELEDAYKNLLGSGDAPAPAPSDKTE